MIKENEQKYGLYLWTQIDFDKPLSELTNIELSMVCAASFHALHPLSRLSLDVLKSGLCKENYWSSIYENAKNEYFARLESLLNDYSKSPIGG